MSKFTHNIRILAPCAFSFFKHDFGHKENEGAQMCPLKLVTASRKDGFTMKNVFSFCSSLNASLCAAMHSEEVKERQAKMAKVMPFVYGALIVLMFPMVFADGHATEMVEAVVKVAARIVTVVGVILLLVGIVKFAIAHANDSGPDQQKSAMMIATGVVCDILGLTDFLHLPFSSWV